MKRTVICVILLAVMTVTGLLLLGNTGRTAADISERLVRLEKISRFADPRVTADFAGEIGEEWNAFCTDNIFLTNNECAFEISLALSRINAKLRSGDTDIAEECRTAGELITIYEKSVLPTPENVF